MGNWQSWTDAELHQFERYFKSLISQLTLFQKIREINPDRSYESISRQIRRMREQDGRIPSKEATKAALRVGYFDIESTGLNQFGLMLCWHIKAAGKNHFDSGIIKRSELLNYSFDKRITSELLTAFKNYDVIYGHWAVDGRFDIPMIRTKALWHGIEDELPSRNQIYILDTWDIAKRKLRLHSNRLDAIGDALGIKVKKTPLSARTWQMAAYGEPKALAYIFHHNRNDVLLLEEIHKRLKCVENPIHRSI